MSERYHHRRPETFKLDDPGVIVMDSGDSSRPLRGTIQIIPEIDTTQVTAVAPTVPVQRIFPWGIVFWAAIGGLILLGIGLSVTRLIEDLFTRNESLGFLGLTFAFFAALAFIIVVAREALGVIRLATIDKLHLRASAALISDDRAESLTIVQDLLKLAHRNPHLARARATLQNYANDIIDGADMIRLAERELMTPLDKEARQLVSSAAQRVSIVTAVSPRALIDVLFVFAASLRLIRQLARLYGGRPSAFGTIQLMRHVIAHLTITGGMAASDTLIQQVLGHGIVAKLSQRLGEGVLNGLLTARLGLAAIDVTRPLPFTALPRPALADLAKDLLRKRDGEE